jgi:uncharacterized membrane protein
MARSMRAFRSRFGLLPRATQALYLVLCALFLGTVVNAQEARIITFDAPGADTKPGDNNGTYSSGINAWGAITGSYQDTKNVFHGFLRSPDGKFTTFDVPAASLTPYNGTAPSSINDLGTITGSYYDANGFGHGFLRTPNGEFTTFDVPGVGGYGSTPIALNLEGAVVGYYTDSNYLFHSFVRNADGTFAAFLAPGQCETNGSQGCYGSEDSNVNAFGLSTGNFMDNTANLVQHGFIRHPNGTFTMFDAPGAGTGQYQGTGCPGCFAGLNQWGAIAGIYADSNTVEHGFLRSPDGKFTTFDAPGAGTGSFQGTGCYSDCPVRLNDWGAITGVYIDANYVYHGYLRSPAGSIVTVDPAGSTFTFPVGINDLGTIVGYYADANGVYHGFLRIRRDK